MSKLEKYLHIKSKRSGSKSGMAPGTMVFIGKQKRDKVRLDLIDFSNDSLFELRDATINQCINYAKKSSVTWINVNGIHDIELIAELGKHFELHALTLEDIVNTSQRLKTEEFQKYIFIVLKMIEFNEAVNEVKIEHVSVILGENFVISFLEDEGDFFDSVRDRIRTEKGRIRTMKTDYLAYALLDSVVDHYFLAIERIGDRIETIDDRIMVNSKQEDINDIHRLKRHILSLRKAVWPLREELGALTKSESGIIHPESKLYWRDLYDHTVQIIDIVETYRDLLGSMQEIYLSSISNRMNEIMKVLTMIATIFIPLTFIVGVYGMNFETMPELQWPWGYYMIWGIMLVISLGLVIFFKRRKWI